MDSVIRAAIVYLMLLVLFRITGKRSLAQITTFDAVLLLIFSEAIQQALIDNDNSMTNAFIIIVTLLGLDVLFSVVAVRVPLVDRLLNDVPLVLIEDGRVHRDRMQKSRVSEDDILEQARTTLGVERLDQIRYAILERGGEISVIPRYVSWAAPGPTDSGPAGS